MRDLQDRNSLCLPLAPTGLRLRATAGGWPTPEWRGIHSPVSSGGIIQPLGTGFGTHSARLLSTPCAACHTMRTRRAPPAGQLNRRIVLRGPAGLVSPSIIAATSIIATSRPDEPIQWLYLAASVSKCAILWQLAALPADRDEAAFPTRGRSCNVWRSHEQHRGLRTRAIRARGQPAAGIAVSLQELSAPSSLKKTSGIGMAAQRSSDAGGHGLPHQRKGGNASRGHKVLVQRAEDVKPRLSNNIGPPASPSRGRGFLELHLSPRPFDYPRA